MHSPWGHNDYEYTRQCGYRDAERHYTDIADELASAIDIALADAIVGLTPEQAQRFTPLLKLVEPDGYFGIALNAILANKEADAP